MLHDFKKDIDAIGRSTAIPTLLETVALATGMGFVAVARVTDTRWITCSAVDHINFGLQAGDELKVENTLCHEVRLCDEAIVISDVDSDARFKDHQTPAKYGFRSYVSVLIKQSDGSFFGTLCAFDGEPRQLDDTHVLEMMKLFAKMIGDSLDADEALVQSNDELSRERGLTDVQDQYIAILAHDLRNPVNALTAGLRMIERCEIDTKAANLVGLMRGSVNRMGLLIENLLDQARSRDGGGIIIERRTTDTLDEALTQIISELQAVAPDQKIEADIDISVPVNCDVARVTQLFSNLLGNAITHGQAAKPIRVTAEIENDTLMLSVANKGLKISDEMMPTLFMPFERGNDRPSRDGLGLGLYIAKEIAKGHGGTLDVTSSDEETVFTFKMPGAVAPQS